MINLLISGNETAWEDNEYYFDPQRCLTEYILPKYRERFSSLSESSIAELKTMPCIFAYEDWNKQDAYIGWLTDISPRQQNVRLAFRKEQERIDRRFFNDHSTELDLGRWEMNRTHWTIKDLDMADVQRMLQEAGTLAKKPTVFVSYCWTPIENQRRVFDLVSRLENDGIKIIIDKNDLRPGQDINYFMEQALSSCEIDFILMICNRDYAAKANNRTGGVGRESEIIISQISSQPLQTKYIPIVIEYDENGKPCLPTAFASRYFIDLTAENAYESLLAAIKKVTS